MNYQKAISRQGARATLAGVITATLLITAPDVFAQSASATLRGQVTTDEKPVAGARVTATNTQTGLTRSAQSGSERGSYTLRGSAARYLQGRSHNSRAVRLRRLVTLQVGQTATLDLGVAGDVDGPRIGHRHRNPAVRNQHLRSRHLRLAEADRSSCRRIRATSSPSRTSSPGVQFVTNGDGSTANFAAARRQPTA